MSIPSRVIRLAPVSTFTKKFNAVRARRSARTSARIRACVAGLFSDKRVGAARRAILNKSRDDVGMLQLLTVNDIRASDGAARGALFGSVPTKSKAATGLLDIVANHEREVSNVLYEAVKRAFGPEVTLQPLIVDNGMLKIYVSWDFVVPEPEADSTDTTSDTSNTTDTSGTTDATSGTTSDEEAREWKPDHV